MRPTATGQHGVALSGIALVNVEAVTGFRYELPTLADASGWLQLFVQQRFFPLFSLLFGISFALIFASADRRGASPRLVLLRRPAVLLPRAAPPVSRWCCSGWAEASC